MRSLRAVMLSALAVSLLNPHVCRDIVLLIGSVPGASLLWFFTLALGVAWLARPSSWRILDVLVAIMMFSVAIQSVPADYSKRLWNLYSTQVLRGYAAPPVL